MYSVTTPSNHPRDGIGTGMSQTEMTLSEDGRWYTYRYTVTTRMTRIKVGSDESHFNVSWL